MPALGTLRSLGRDAIWATVDAALGSAAHHAHAFVAGFEQHRELLRAWTVPPIPAEAVVAVWGRSGLGSVPCAAEMAIDTDHHAMLQPPACEAVACFLEDSLGD